MGLVDGLVGGLGRLGGQNALEFVWEVWRG